MQNLRRIVSYEWAQRHGGERVVVENDAVRRRRENPRAIRHGTARHGTARHNGG